MHTVRQIFEKVAYEGCSGRQIYSWLKYDLNFKTRNNKYLSLSNIFTILKSTFYYGVFEFPKGGGNWYQGKYTSLITKELFDQAQSSIKNRQRFESPNRSREFAFTKLMTCGKCGSGITADEKFKKLLDGSVNRHVDYVCTRAKDQNCRGVSISEETLIIQLTDLIDKVSLDKLGMREKLEAEIDRYSHFRYAVLDLDEIEMEKQKKLDMKKYAKYVLEKGTIFEKRNLLVSLNSRLQIKDKKVLCNL
ncbi:MAG TPA: recombinase family protein [Candidatus Magasanikbacteria bacterium]|nr:recombinase family protein [Candidatus Magasanikbacteria bacterium]